MIRRPTTPEVRVRLRSGAATVELALVLPILAFVFFAGADFSRVYYRSQALTDAAYKGAQFASNADLAARLPYESAEEAALADLTSWSPPATVSVVYSNDPNLNTVRVTVSNRFEPICRHFGIAETLNLSRSVEVRLHPSSELPEGGEP